MYSRAQTDDEALRHGAGAVWLPRDVLRVAGPDALSFLQGQVSQDVLALDVGGSAWSFVLQPQGKVDALVRLTRTAEDEVVVDVDAGYGDAVAARLNRFKLRVKADIEPLAWRCLAVRGVEGVTGSTPAFGTGADVLGESPTVPEGVRECSPDAYDVLRIEAGWPAMGAELTDRTIPAETGILDRTVSFTKGCYTGQELVARIDSRGGHVPRHLRGVVVDGDRPPVGAAVVAGDDEVGSLTSVAVSPRLAAPVALAYVHRDVEPPAAVEVRWDGGVAPATVHRLPVQS
jgi:folate-binding protein YgfZ